MKKKNASRLRVLVVLLAGSLAVQSFDCASPEYTTAKVAINNKDWAKAQEYLEKVVAKNPKNAEAWYDLSQVHKERGNISSMITALSEAEKNTTAPDLRKKIASAQLNGWVEAYNRGISSYSRYNESNDRAALDSAITFINGAVQLKPAFPETHSFLGVLQEMAGDTAKAMESFNTYVRVQQPNMDFLSKNNLYSGMQREAALQSLGAPASTQSRASGSSGDSVKIDIFKINGQDVYLFSSNRGGKPYSLQGIRANVPADWLQQEKELVASFDPTPYAALASAYTARKQYEPALENLNRLLVLDPANENAMTMRVQIYQDQNKTDEAMASLAEVVRKNPNNKIARTQYATLLLKLNKFDEAIREYDAALSVDPSYESALFNLAAAYKNKAGQIQNEEKAKLDRDPKYKINEASYLPYLTKAAEYFQRYRNNPERRNDFRTLQQLANIYEVTNDKTRLSALIVEMEGMESQFSTDPAYYETLAQIYTRQNQTDKAKAAFEKADRLK